MATVREETKGKIRDLPIAAELTRLLEQAADRAGIAVVRVTSGGQASKGSGGKRIGSTRHDNGRAADLQLLADGKHALDFTEVEDLPVIEAFVTAAASLGANGIGAGIGYMPPTTLHIGFGTSPQDHTQLVWGAGGRAANAPKWLKKAAQEGWANPAPRLPVLTWAALPVEPVGRFVVAARDGLILRAGPGLTFDRIRTLPPGRELTVLAFDGVHKDWARVDLNDDHLIDGHLHSAFIVPAARPGRQEKPAASGPAPEQDDADEGVEEPVDA
jgi:hypothetical protein